VGMMKGMVWLLPRTAPLAADVVLVHRAHGTTRASHRIAAEVRGDWLRLRHVAGGTHHAMMGHAAHALLAVHAIAELAAAVHPRVLISASILARRLLLLMLVHLLLLLVVVVHHRRGIPLASITHGASAEVVLVEVAILPLHIVVESSSSRSAHSITVAVDHGLRLAAKGPTRGTEAVAAAKAAGGHGTVGDASGGEAVRHLGRVAAST